MAKVHEYVLVLPDGKYQVTKTNGPIGGQQSRQQVGGHAESFDPQLGEGFTAQINEDRVRLNLPPNATFDGVAGNVLIGRSHGADMWGLTAVQQEDVVARLQLSR
jgi:hypothetical protein